MKSVPGISLFAVQGDERRGPDGDGIGPQRQGLGRVGAAAYSPRGDEADLAVQTQLAEGLSGHDDGGDSRDTAVVQQDLRRGAGARHHAVDDDGVGAGLGRQLDVVVHAAGPQLDVDGHAPVGGLPKLFDLHRQVVGPEPVRVAGRAALVDPLGEVSHLGYLIKHLHAHKQPAGPRLCALPDHNLDGLSLHQMAGVEAVPAGKDLVDQLVRGVPLRL